MNVKEDSKTSPSQRSSSQEDEFIGEIGETP